MPEPELQLDPKAPARRLWWIALAFMVLSLCCWRWEANGGEQLVTQMLHRLGAPALASYWGQSMTLVTELGNGTVLVYLLAVLVAWRRNRRELQDLIVALVVAGLVASVLKHSFDRGRPEADRFQSWPSGHTAAITAFAGCLLHRRAVFRVALALVILVGLSRVWLLRHWPADVLGGFAVGSAAAAVAMTLPNLTMLRPLNRAACLLLVTLAMTLFSVDLTLGSAFQHPGRLLMAPLLLATLLHQLHAPPESSRPDAGAG
jgi:undecaprenyl-diphosphatase